MPRPPDRRPRFTPAQRRAHRATAALMLVCLATAACLYLPPLSQLVGRRRLLATVHEWSGLLLPVPLLLALATRAMRRDATRLGRFTAADRDWLRALRRRSPHRPAGKFNAGQKLYAQWTLGTILVMLGTGLLMWFTHLAPAVWRTGATFVHDWFALAVAVVVAGHLRMAARDPEARRGMRTGSVERDWAAREHPQWTEEGQPAGAERRTETAGRG
ncbi:cytochrome b/b6 domain-containing protein [Kitasatospora cineracea]|uniref:cytochrome b/b6 domain-containing protein n=1 Tax=Kitasatospora cineracea TaxID=88074 RepID=UPI003682F827